MPQSVTCASTGVCPTRVYRGMKLELFVCTAHVFVQAALDWRGAAARELHQSECVYVSRLGAVLKVNAGQHKNVSEVRMFA